ncbi:MAG: biotin--[acetyl-CoA-carboxylase] ligase [Caldimicrobium sp.]|nr:biotin--[acetyl-CoA-carboxylase] ligase [Caldimicrobium sp.]MCX7873865.1 biotin--[acetyl-CoA-carboxylase] ligase [Caldimicrobium sp.]MDW8094742.1 biotin--[acetyl-CoA-carboxylase] ligase [Caldimicrobium sp.]
MAYLKEKHLTGIPSVIGSEIWHFPLLESGFQRAKELIITYPKSAHGRVLLIDEITKAKGRFKRTWFANKGGLWLTITLFEEFLPEHSGLFSLLFGVALGRLMHELGLKEVHIKWINDLHYKGKKLAGILIEKWQSWYLVGIGLNLNNPLPQGLPAINLKTLMGSELSPLKVLETLIPILNYYYKALWEYERRLLIDEKGDPPNPIIEDFLKYSDTLQRCIYYSYNLDEEVGLFGFAKNISPKGGLIIVTPQEEIEVTTGEIIYI